MSEHAEHGPSTVSTVAGYIGMLVIVVLLSAIVAAVTKLPLGTVAASVGVLLALWGTYALTAYAAED